jgi:hypothetical protein
MNREELARDWGWGGAMSEDLKRDIGQAVSSAARWRKLEREALDVASGLADPEAKRKKLFVAESHRVLAERIELRAELLEALRETKSGPGSDNATGQ